MALSEIALGARQRLVELDTPQALEIVGRLDRNEITEQQFIREANGCYASITRSDPSGGLRSAVRLHAPRSGLEIPDHTYASIFGKTDRGERVTATEQAILRGDINPTEVLNA